MLYKIARRDVVKAAPSDYGASKQLLAEYQRITNELTAIGSNAVGEFRNKNQIISLTASKQML
jgi:hypothetical protein